MTVRFGARTVVDRVDLTVARGEVVSLIGANGAGKSTLMNAVGGFVAGRGRVEVFGRSADGRAPHRRAALGLGRTFQDAALFPDLTVRETVEIAPEARGRSGFVGVALGLPRTRRVERAKRVRAGRSSTSWASAPTASGSFRSCRPAPAASSSWRRSSPPMPGCCASTSPPPGSPSARPRRSGRCCCASARSWGRRCWSSSTTCRW